MVVRMSVRIVRRSMMLVMSFVSSRVMMMMMMWWWYSFYVGMMVRMRVVVRMRVRGVGVFRFGHFVRMPRVGMFRFGHFIVMRRRRAALSCVVMRMW